MDSKSVGSSAGILALIAIFVHALGGGSPQERVGQKDPQAMPDLSASASQSDVKELPVALQGPWSTTQQYFHRDPTISKKALNHCLRQPDDTCVPSLVESLYAFPPAFDRSTVHAVIATVPDPLHTRMAMETDRYLDAIQQAAFSSGYELARQWLPWTVKGAAEKTGATLASADRVNFDWERLPGLLLFRHHFLAPDRSASDYRAPSRSFGPDSLLLVFVVGETPTAGVNGYQFNMARATIQALTASSPGTLYIAGPNFSGSFPSITHLLEDAAPAVHHIEMRSGSVANSSYAAQMLSELQTKFVIDPNDPNAGPASLSFHASGPASLSFRQQFEKLARDYLHIKDSQTAQIMETETGFAVVTAENRSAPILRYPRDIAQLRNTYNDAAFAPSASQAMIASPPPVNFSLKDTQSGEDFFPTFSTSHTPLSQKAVLDQIAQRLKRDRIRLLSLSASNVFDTLFLADFLARNCPDTRVVLPNADLLFVDQANSGRLSGLMAISPFPLFPEGTVQGASGHGNDIATFASSDQAAEFNAVLSLLAGMSPEMAITSAEYRQRYAPAGTQGDPASDWLLVLSPRGWMPINFLEQGNEMLGLAPPPPATHRIRRTAPWSDAASPSQTSVKQALSGLKAGGPLWFALCAAVALGSLIFCYRLWNLKRHSELRVWSSFCLEDSDPAPTQDDDGKTVLRARYFCMNAVFSNLAVANALLLLPMLANGWSEGIHYRAILLLLCVAFLSSTVTFGLLCICWCPKHSRSIQTHALNIGLFLIAALTVGVWYRCCFSNGAISIMFNFRILTLAASVCPLWPLLLVTLGLVAMAFFQLRRFTWCDRRQPYLNTSLFDSLLQKEFTDTTRRMEKRLKSSTGTAIWEAAGQRCSDDNQPLAMLLWILVLPLIGIVVLDDSLTSFEPRVFTFAVEGLFAILGVYTLSNFLRFLACWKLLRAFLLNLNSIVLGRFFGEVSEFASGSGPIWLRDVKLMSLSTVINGYIALHNLERRGRASLKPGLPQYHEALQNFLLTPTDSPSGSKPGRGEFVKAYRTFRQCADEISAKLGTDILREYWKSNQLDFVGAFNDPANAASDPKPKSSRKTAAPVNETEDVRETEPILALAAIVGGTGSVRLRLADRPQPMTNGKPVKQESVSPSKDEYELASRYVALHYSAYIGYVLHQLQNLLICSSACFVLLMLGLNSFAFQAPQTLFHFATAGLIIGGIIILMALAQMERDPILSRLSGSKEGELGKDFYLRALTFGIAPILAVLSTEFPSIAQYASTWVQPMSAALH